MGGAGEGGKGEEKLMDQSKSIKALRGEFKEHGVFYTDSRLAMLLKSLVPQDVTEVYDPTCGGGALLSVWGDDVRKYGQELNIDQARLTADTLVNCDIVGGDTLMEPAFGDRRFRAIVANPPFSVKWNPEAVSPDDPRFADAPCLPPPSKADYAFLLHILHHLADDGVAACLEFPGILYRGQREGRIRQWMVERNYVDKVLHIPGGHFEDTTIATCILVLRKDRTEQTIRFVDTENDIEADIPIDDVRVNGYNLSVSAYVQKPEPTRPEVDVRRMELDAQEQTIDKLRRDIEFSIAVAKIEGWDLDRIFIRRLKALVSEYPDDMPPTRRRHQSSYDMPELQFGNS